MGDVRQFKLPDAGEGLTEADILKWLVKPGDTVKVNDIIVEIETAKAVVELPSPYAGVVTELHAAEGDTVPVGQPIISVDVAAGSAPRAAASTSETEAQAAGSMVPEPPKREPVLVGYGPRAEGTARRRRRTVEETPTAHEAFNVPPAPPQTDRHRVLAKPPIRKMAKNLGVDLAEIEPTGPNGTISRADVEGAVRSLGRSPGLDDARGERRVPIKGVRKHTAAAMVSSAFTAPHVTEFLTIDISATMELRERVAARRDFADVKVSPLLFVAKAMLTAARRTPEINSSWDEAAGEIVFRDYVNLGIAAATERGLIVPNIKNADQMSLHDLAAALGRLTETARSGKTPPEDLKHGTISITNVGVFGVDSGTPILNPGEAAILAFGAVRRMPWVVDEQIVPRWVTTLALSFDHRLVDGEQGSRFLADIGAILSDPGMALL